MIPKTLFTLVAALFLSATPLMAATPTWIHVRVDEGEKGANVKVNLPLSVAEVALDLAGEDLLGDVDIHFDDSDLDVADLRRMWRELEASGDAELVRVEDDGETVRIYRSGDNLNIRIDETGEEATEVRIKVPTAVVDALLQGEGESLDLRGAIEALERAEIRDLVEISEGETEIKIWID